MEQKIGIRFRIYMCIHHVMSSHSPSDCPVPFKEIHEFSNV